MTDSKHIVFLSRWYPHRYDPMLGLFIQRHAQAVALKEIVSVIYAHGTENTLSKIYEIDVKSNDSLNEIIVYYQLSTFFIRPISKLINLFRLYNSVNKGLKIAEQKEGSISLIHVHVLTRLALVALWLKLTKGIPYGITEHWSRYLKVRNEFHGWGRICLTRIAVKQASFVTTVTENLASAMRSFKLHANFIILPNVVDVNMFQPIHKSKKNNFRFIHISCFEDRSKNISGILRTIAKLKAIRTDFEFVMVGEGQDEKEMHDLAKKSGLGLPELKFTGLQQSKELAASLAESDALVLFSNYENLPVVIPEAFACGLPVISTSVGGIAEIINSENGILMKANDESQLLDALIWMMDNHDSYNSKKIREAVVDKNSREAVSHFLTGLYEKALKKKY
jgi:glycosyltransferase involved in cell wall biosynthesis